ncbi:unnamed protein product, partial [Brassicogethes aeneus]
RKKEKEREASEVDDCTQTSSPGGGWQGRLSAFLHVHRGSRASSRKSSRASDASDLSELGGPWLNLPLLLLSSAANVAPEDMDWTGRDSADAASADPADHAATTPLAPALSMSQPRRRSIYNFPFFLKHQDAVETHEESTSPLPQKKTICVTQSLHPAMAEDVAKPKRGSIIRRKRVGSVKNRPAPSLAPTQRAESEPVNTADVSILVTEASPETAFVRPSLLRQQSEATVVQVLVHRESEEYTQEDEDTPQITVTSGSDPNVAELGSSVADGQGTIDITETDS